MILSGLTLRLLGVEALLTVLSVVLLLVKPPEYSPFGDKLWHSFGRLAQRRTLSVIVVGLFAFVLRFALLPVLPAPEPQVHDEFSHLLAADTFVTGRLTNPTHPFWVHFETFHVNQHPTYASMYPPAQGLVLAVGQLLTGAPWVGLFFSTACMSAALCWMFQGWLPSRWALVGGLISVIRIATFSYWANSYWGGAIVATGGALVLGAFPRLRKNIRWGDAAILAFGMMVLVNSRPYEGFLLCMPVVTMLGIALVKRRHRIAKASLIGSASSFLLVLAIGSFLMGFYFWRVTGNPLRMPYQVNRETYQMANALLWQRPRADLQHRHKQMRDYYTVWLAEQIKVRSSLRTWFRSVIRKMAAVWLFYLGPILTIALIGFPRTVRDKRIRPLLVVGALAVLGMLSESWFFPHYAAPFTGLIYVLVLQAMRHLRFYHPGNRSIGRSLVLTIPGICLVMFVLAVLTLRSAPPNGREAGAWCCTKSGNTERSRLIAQLTARGGTHLVLVRFDPNQKIVTDKWVHNGADIDKAAVVFARDMGEAKNAQLIEYYEGRELWVLLVTEKTTTLTAYHHQSINRLNR